MWPTLYNLLVLPLLWTASKLASLSNQKIRQSLDGKKDLWSRLDANMQDRDSTKTLIWFHVPSAGEFLQAQPVLEMFLENGLDCAVTFNSVSGEKWVKRSKLFTKKQALHIDYLPFDFRDSINRWIEKVKPTALVFVKFDLWPNTIWEAEKAGIPIFLISATLQPKTLRYTTSIGRSLYGDLYKRFKGIYCVTEEDQDRFQTTKPGLKNTKVVGDTRFDSVINQRDRLPAPLLPDYVKRKTVFVVGSCWPPDEECIFPALKEALERFPDFMLIIAPHEPTESHLANSETFFDKFRIERLSKVNDHPGEETDIVLVDSVGVLSSIYKIGNLAFIGGGFTTGVHNVMEPCALGIPAFCGPFNYNSPEALHLIKEELAFSVSNEEEFRKKLFELLENPDKSSNLGNRSRTFIESQCGASEECYNLISKEINEN